MKRFGVGLVATSFVGGLVLVQCGGIQSTSSDTNTNWLQHCELTTDCPDALECVSGVCTRFCNTGQDCDGLGGDAVCSSDMTQGASACTQACAAVSECPGAPNAWTCQKQACVPVVGSDTSEGGAGNLGGTGGTQPTGGAQPTGGGSSGGDAQTTGGDSTGGTQAAGGTSGGGAVTISGSGGDTEDLAGGRAGDPTDPSGGIGGDGGNAGGSVSGGSGGLGAAACEALSQAISTETSGAHACTAIVRLAYETRGFLGFQLLCAPYAQVDEVTAQQTAEVDTGYGLGATVMSGADPQDEYVFYEEPTDFGGVGVVSVRNGITVFGGSVVWAGTGEITYPTSWRPASELGPGCTPMVNTGPPATRGIDLSHGEGAMDQTQINAVMDQVWVTALADGMWLNQYVFDAMVLLYPRSVGAMNPATTEWIVLINFGWLE